MSHLLKKYRTLLSKNGISTPFRQAHFISQLDHESGLKPIEENLRYSKKTLLRVFKKYFNTHTAELYRYNPKEIANRVYANRMGNGDYRSGDGYKYRGRGFIQLTGRHNYKALSDYTGIDFVNKPDLLLEEANAMIAAVWFWNKRNLNIYADLDDIRTITKRINGGYNGLNHRKKLLNKYKNILT